MKLLALIVSTLVATALAIGAAMLIVWHSDGELGPLEVLPLVASTVFVYGPIMLGSLSAHFNADTSDASRAAFRRWRRIVIGVECLAALAIVAYAILLPAPPWIPVAFIGIGVVLTAAAPAVGSMVRRHDERRPSTTLAWQPISREEIRHKVSIVALTFGVTIVVAFALIAVLIAVFGAGDANVGGLLLLAASFAFLAAGLACIVVSLGWNRRLRELLGNDLGMARDLAKVVLGRKQRQLSEDELGSAAKYAATVPPILAFQLAYLSLLYIAIALQQVNFMIGGSPSAWSLWILVGLVVVLLITFPLLLVRINRARRYAREHAELLHEEPAVP